MAQYSSLALHASGTRGWLLIDGLSASYSKKNSSPELLNIITDKPTSALAAKDLIGAPLTNPSVQSADSEGQVMHSPRILN